MVPRQLQPVLGLGSLTLLGLGCIIGTGVFVLTGRAAAEFAGPALAISWVLSGGFFLLIALCYAELASALPSAGSAYAYTYVSMGRFVGWFTGLLILLAYGLAAATVAVGWAGYAVSFLYDVGISVPFAVSAAPGTTDYSTNTISGGANIVAMIGVGLATALLCAGIRTTSTINSALTVFKLGVILAFIVIGLPYVTPENWTPLIPPQTPAPAPGSEVSLLGQIGGALARIAGGQPGSSFGVEGVVVAAAVISFAFIGFEMPTTASEEAKNPRHVPIAMILALAICIALYVAVTLVLTGIVPYTELNSPAPVAYAAAAVGLAPFSFIIKVAALAGLSTVLLTLLFAQTRVFLAMTRDGLMPPIFARLNSAGAPAIGTIGTGAAVALVSGLFDLNALADLTNIGMLGVFALVCLAVIVLRVNSPQLDRPFKTPFYPIVPVIGVAGSLFLLQSVVRTQSLIAMAIFFAIGIALFFISGAWRSVARATSSAPAAAAPRAPQAPPLAPAHFQPLPPPAAPASPPVEARPPEPAPMQPRAESPPPQPAPLPAPAVPTVSDVFISYKREEKERVEGIAEALRQLKLNVWFDAKLTPGHDFDEEINREVRSAKSVFVCWSTRAVESRWVRAEASVGHKRNVLVACFLEECEPWTPFNLVHAEDLSGAVLDGANRAWVKLVEQIGRQCGRPGLGDYLRLNGDRAAMANWVRTYPDDPLAPDVAASLA